MDASLASSSSSASSSNAAGASGAAPGKRTLTAQLAPASAGAGASALPPELKPLIGLTVSDGAGYLFVLEADGSFLVIGAPKGKESAQGKRLRAGDADPTVAQAWQMLAARLLAEHPAAAPAPEAAPAPVESGGESLGSGLAAIGAAVTSGVAAIGSAVSSGVDAIGSFVGDLLAGIVDGVGGAMPSAGVDAGGEPADSPATAAPAPSTPSTPAAPAVKAPIAPGKHASRSSFIRPGLPSTVTDHPTSTALIDAMWPYFDEGDILIGAYLSPGQQAWKVNYHWELVLWVCDQAQGLAIDQAHKTTFAAIATRLRPLAPSPSSGYLDDSQMAIADSSDQAACDARYAALKQAKVDLGAAIAASGAAGKVSGPTAERFELAPQYVKPAGASKHGTGHAFDIKGDNARIAATGRTLGMSAHDDEDYHVHVEFAAGLTPPATP